ncbi:LLM class F420-dependent oxidoreductase [Actinomadura sp. HBU206391]|uniref:LLM class F420-dependent oxidoreductase n=1 Tax=Actinomadura sp. HBU206391 TaxID=2731692 RepID=UPI0016500117|nr:LLM class F420-dependent oxidoreductase [Actinomadura sp. HBU206391]MBC6462118.1 LLM class F420-dependent oxidoreductase [Actinomadura sp. HBU206391]
MELGPVGIWSIGLRSEDQQARGEITEAAAELEELGYGAIWLGGSPGIEHAVPLIEATSRIVVATGILSIWQYAAEDVAAQHNALAKSDPGRFLLGLGVSHGKLVGDDYRRPYGAMMDYLDRLDAAEMPGSERVIAALGPKMLAASRDRAAGAHPYLVPPEHTRTAREVLGAGPLLAPEVKVVLDTDTDRARAIARGHLAMYLQLPNYTENLLRLGFAEDDLRDGGSDRLVDSVFALGDLDAVRERVAAHHEAGADHVTLQVITADRTQLPRREWRELAAVARES